MRVTELDLSPAALACLRAADIRDVEKLGTSRDLAERPGFGAGVELYEIVCALNRRGLSLPVGRYLPHVPRNREREMLRLRVVDGLTLAEIGARFDVGQERVRQLLNLYFGMSGVPPAAKRHRRVVTAKRRADDLAAARGQQAQIIAAWRSGLEIRDLVQGFDLHRGAVEEIILIATTDADRAARAEARRGSRRPGAGREKHH